MQENERLNARIREYLHAQFSLGGGQGLGDQDPLLEGGVIDSLGVLELVDFLQEEFSIHISDDDLDAENFGSIERIVSLINGKR